MIKTLRNKFHDLRNTGNDTRASIELSRLGLEFTPWTKSAIRPAALLQLLNEILINDRRTVIEFGAGISTIYLAKVLSSVGGRLISFEDDAGWAGIVTQMLHRHGLQDWVTSVVAPLGPCANAPTGLEWYDEAAVRDALNGRTVDLALVDGPKAHHPASRLARYPAYGVTSPFLAPRAAVALDDITRKGERDVLDKWRALPGFDFDVSIAHSGIALLRRGPYFMTEM